MTAPRARRGSGIVELLVVAALGGSVLGALTAAITVGSRALRLAGIRSEAEDVAQLAVEAFQVDVRRAGYDPAAIGLAGLTSARDRQLGFAADLDGDGAVDGSSEETVGYVCNPATRRLSRTVGAQSLPLADDVVTCRFTYRDASGTALAVPVAGLDPAERARVRSIALALVLRPAGTTTPTERTIEVALRTAS